jgi:metal-sulfur cluster biosynthetic enzyme
MVSVDQVLSSLRNVVDPELHKDIVSMGMVKDLNINNGKVSLISSLQLLRVLSTVISNRTFEMQLQT